MLHNTLYHDAIRVPDFRRIITVGCQRDRSVIPYSCNTDKPVFPCKEILLSSSIASIQLVILCTGFPSLSIIPATPLWIQTRLNKTDRLYSYSDNSRSLTHSIYSEEDRLWHRRVSHSSSSHETAVQNKCY